jgi:hypothetical protein
MLTNTLRQPTSLHVCLTFLYSVRRAKGTAFCIPILRSLRRHLSSVKAVHLLKPEVGGNAANGGIARQAIRNVLFRIGNVCRLSVHKKVNERTICHSRRTTARYCTCLTTRYFIRITSFPRLLPRGWWRGQMKGSSYSPKTLKDGI